MAVAHVHLHAYGACAHPGLALLALLGTLLVQAPPGLASDPQAYDAWLVGLKPKYGGFTGILDKLGMFSVFQSVWFRAILVCLTTSIVGLLGQSLARPVEDLRPPACAHEREPSSTPRR